MDYLFFLFLSYIPFFITGFIENVLVIHIVHKTREMHTPTNYLLANMAVSDAVTVMLLPFYNFVKYQLGSVNNNFEKFTCKSVALVQICIIVYSTTLTLGSLSKSLRRPLLRWPEVKKPRNDAVRMLENDLSP